jgi:predicted RNA-binding Zn-ribbon protein involved in translation (DUF1610 family)
MKLWIARLGAAALLLGAALTPATADKDKKPALPKCSSCKMTMSTKKDKTRTQAVKIGNKTFYCCAGCKEHVKTASHSSH